MNDESPDDDLDLGTEKTPRPWKKILIIVVGVLLLLGAGGGATYFLLGPSEEAGKKGEEQAGADVAGEPEEVVQEEKGPAVYHSLAPVFVVNLPSNGRARLLQVGVEVMTRSADLVEFLKHNDPMVRHNLLKLFGSRRVSDLSDRAGKEKLQADVLAELQRIIEELSGPGEVEAVYFSSFVMQ